jgi:hypothetical protein
MPNVTYSISAAKYSEFKRLFLITYPNQTLDSTNPLTDDEWIVRRGKLFFRGACFKAQREEYEQQNSPVYDNDIITEG